VFTARCELNLLICFRLFTFFKVLNYHTDSGKPSEHLTWLLNTMLCLWSLSSLQNISVFYNSVVHRCTLQWVSIRQHASLKTQICHATKLLLLNLIPVFNRNKTNGFRIGYSKLFSNNKATIFCWHKCWNIAWYILTKNWYFSSNTNMTDSC
jgi:hypothetical protein